MNQLQNKADIFKVLEYVAVSSSRSLPPGLAVVLKAPMCRPHTRAATQLWRDMQYFEWQRPLTGAGSWAAHQKGWLNMGIIEDNTYLKHLKKLLWKIPNIRKAIRIV